MLAKEFKHVIHIGDQKMKFKYRLSLAQTNVWECIMPMGSALTLQSERASVTN